MHCDRPCSHASPAHRTVQPDSRGELARGAQRCTGRRERTVHCRDGPVVEARVDIVAPDGSSCVDAEQWQVRREMCGEWVGRCGSRVGAREGSKARAGQQAGLRRERGLGCSAGRCSARRGGLSRRRAAHAAGASPTSASPAACAPMAPPELRAILSLSRCSHSSRAA